jgi:hypothetical protein
MREDHEQLLHANSTLVQLTVPIMAAFFQIPPVLKDKHVTAALLAAAAFAAAVPCRKRPALVPAAAAL